MGILLGTGFSEDSDTVARRIDRAFLESLDRIVAASFQLSESPQVGNLPPQFCPLTLNVRLATLRRSVVRSVANRIGAHPRNSGKRSNVPPSASFDGTPSQSSSTAE